MAVNKNNNPDVIRCYNCRKIIGEGTISDGKISIKCKCGTLNTIEAVPKLKAPEQKNFVYNSPYQNRLGLVKK